MIVFAVMFAVVVGMPVKESVYFDASAPPSVLVVRFTVFPMPAFASENSATAFKLTTPLTTPTKVKLLPEIVAALVPSYTLLLAVNEPEIVRALVSTRVT